MPFTFPRCEVVPLPDHQASFRIDGSERLRWHFGPSYPRPFFYPLVGPSGNVLTRMGHPGDPSHDHHRSIWFAHEKVLGINFWGDQTTARIRQKNWLCYKDGADEAIMAARLGWFDGHDPKELLDQMPHRTVQVEPRRPIREQGVARNEDMFVRAGILSKIKTDSSGRRHHRSGARW